MLCTIEMIIISTVPLLFLKHRSTHFAGWAQAVAEPWGEAPAWWSLRLGSQARHAHHVQEHLLCVFSCAFIKSCF